MIKRLKWNVLYAESAQDDSNLSDSSAESVERGSTTAQAVLDQLATNDPSFSVALGRHSYSSSSDAEDTHQQNDSAQYRVASEEEQPVDGSDDADYAEWRECDLCPGKRFLTDADVEAHLSSKFHKRALKRFEAGRNVENGDNPAPDQSRVGANLQAFSAPSNSIDSDHLQNPASSALTQNTQQRGEEDQLSPNEGLKVTEEQQRKANKRKAAVKRRLRRLKDRKWKKTGQGEGPAEAPTRQEEKQKVKNRISEEEKESERKREKLRKVGSSRAKQEVKDPSDVRLKDGHADGEASPSSQRRELKKRSRKSRKERVGENGSNGSKKRKKSRRELETSAKDKVSQ